MTYALDGLWRTLSVSASPLLSLLIIPLVLKYIEKKYWSVFAEKKNVWKQYIGKNRYIKECYSEWYKIDNESDFQSRYIFLVFTLISLFFLAEVAIIVSISMFVYWWIVPILIEHQLNNYYNLSSDNVFLVTSLIIALLCTYLPVKLVSYIEDDIDVTENNIIEKYSAVKWYAYNSIMFSIIQFWVFLIIFIEGEERIRTFGLLALIIPLGICFISISCYTRDKSQLKNCINEKFSRRYPILEITTMGAEHHIGKIKNIFKHESIILISNNIETIILWDAVATIKEFMPPNKYQKKLSDFDIET